MPRLLTVCYPELAPCASSFVTEFRRRHDAPRHERIQAHFTLVFGCPALGLDEYTSHVTAVAKTCRPITFSCKYAMLGNDDESEVAYVFLVPDEGNAEISLLHDRLYTGPLRPHLRLDLPYIPHITIGTTTSPEEAKQLCDELNRVGVSIQGSLLQLTVGHVEDGKFQNLSSHALGEA
ncbi:MAG: 2'-5' RNA ligase family protein [Rhizobiaceae bacterium]|jgi:2'-5' RNA ligase|nr:2'-5' RNA ligase family protein [Rhizobiaceae bacterium]